MEGSVKPFLGKDDRWDIDSGEFWWNKVIRMQYEVLLLWGAQIWRFFYNDIFTFDPVEEVEPSTVTKEDGIVWSEKIILAAEFW